jgi:hypothetical protein
MSGQDGVASHGTQARSESRTLGRYVLVFAIAFAVFIMGPPFLGYTFPLYPLMHVADVFDLLTPLVLLPLFWLLFRFAAQETATTRENVIFMVFAAFFVLGQGMHLAANSIGHLTASVPGSDIESLTSFYDETLGHYLWHFGAIGFSAVIAYRQVHGSYEEDAFTFTNMIAGAIYGFVFFAMVVEGVTAPMGLPFAFAFIIASLVYARKTLRRQPLVTFFLIGYLVALVLAGIWGIWQHGLPEFSKVGLIK